MKRIATGLAIMSMTTLAQGAVSVQGRFDYKRLETKTTTAATATTTSTSKDSSGEYEVNLARVLTSGKINDSLTFDMELDLKQASGTNANGGALNDFVDSMVLTKKIGESFSVKLGKQDPLLGGFEWAQADSDVYAASTFYTDGAPNSVGLSAHYSLLGNTLSLVHLETATNSGTSNSTTDKKVTGALLAGSYMDGMIGTRFSHHQVGAAAGRTDLTGLGLQFVKDLFVVQLDYSMATKKNQGTNDAAATVDAKLNTMVAHVRYNHENYKPFVKYIMDKSEGSYALTNDVAGAESERIVIEAGLEYSPNKDEDMRYHLVYLMAETKQKTGTTGTTARGKIENDTILAGVKFGFNLL